MKTEPSKELIEVDNLTAKVRVSRVVDATGWSQYVSHKNALKLHRVHRALKAGDIEAAGKDAEVFELGLAAAG